MKERTCLIMLAGRTWVRLGSTARLDLRMHILPFTGKTSPARFFGEDKLDLFAYRLLSYGDKVMRARILSLAVLLAFAFGPANAQPITLKFSHFSDQPAFFSSTWSSLGPRSSKRKRTAR
jgi:hypothetical protein